MLIEGLEDSVLYFVLITASLVLFLAWCMMRSSCPQVLHPEQRGAVQETRDRMQAGRGWSQICLR